MSFNINQLPKFILWKNTAALSDGYVVGLEPATNFPNPRSHEENQGRVIELQPQETASFRVTLDPLTSHEEVQQMRERVNRLKEEVSPQIHHEPKAGWTP